MWFWSIIAVIMIIGFIYTAIKNKVIEIIEEFRFIINATKRYFKGTL